MSALIFAFMLTGLLTMSAIAVDLGSAYTERRHDQNTVDAAAMSAAVESSLGGGIINDVVAEVRDKVDTTLGTPVSAAEWASCTDAGQLDHTTKELQVGNPTISPVSDCISFSLDFARIRVKLPDQEALGVFGPALGFGTIKTSAAAVAQIESPGGISAPPFVALSTATQGDFVCLRTSDNPQPQTLMDGRGPGVTAAAGTRPDPCDKTVYDTSSENYGTLQPYRYLDGCKQQNSDTEVAISLGIDHIMGHFPNGYDPFSPDPEKSQERVDGGANCTVAYPNTFWIDTGFNAQGLRCALISLTNDTLCNGVDPRFHQGPYVQDTYKFAGEKMDNSPPWQFLRPAYDLHLDGAPPACVVLATFRDEDDAFDPGKYVGVPDLDDYDEYDYYTDVQYRPDGTTVNGATFQTRYLTDSSWEHYDRYDALIQCLETWDPTSDPELFTEELADSPRFAFIPKVAEPDLSKVSKVHIESFMPSYMYRLYQSAPSGAKNCDPKDAATGRLVSFLTHDAGQRFRDSSGNPKSCGDSNQNVDRLSSIMLACGMVSDELCNKETGYPNFGGRDIYDFRLVE